MKIQHLESTIQKVRKTIKSRVAPTAQAVSLPTRTKGKRVEVGKGGQEIGKWTGFSHFETALTHLFPHDSTQVVDFPRMYDVRTFWGGPEIGFSRPKREVMI